jgi:hypothetical protein
MPQRAELGPMFSHVVEHEVTSLSTSRLSPAAHSGQHCNFDTLSACLCSERGYPNNGLMIGGRLSPSEPDSSALDAIEDDSSKSASYRRHASNRQDDCE